MTTRIAHNKEQAKVEMKEGRSGGTGVAAVVWGARERRMKHLGEQGEHGVESEVVGAILTLDIIKGTPRLTDVDIFTDCQPAISATCSEIPHACSVSGHGKKSGRAAAADDREGDENEGCVCAALSFVNTRPSSMPWVGEGRVAQKLGLRAPTMATSGIRRRRRPAQMETMAARGVGLGRQQFGFRWGRWSGVAAPGIGEGSVARAWGRPDLQKEHTNHGLERAANEGQEMPQHIERPTSQWMLRERRVPTSRHPRYMDRSIPRVRELAQFVTGIDLLEEAGGRATAGFTAHLGGRCLTMRRPSTRFSSYPPGPVHAGKRQWRGVMVSGWGPRFGRILAADSVQESERKRRKYSLGRFSRAPGALEAPISSTLRCLGLRFASRLDHRSPASQQAASGKPASMDSPLFPRPIIYKQMVSLAWDGGKALFTTGGPISA
ncbi:hypothetical protein C8R46DRAFT_1249196 [Mycena filopes]|nr:hypothetical protein C8R46DRAFT_1249196 [Mycena filopes]